MGGGNQKAGGRETLKSSQRKEVNRETKLRITAEFSSETKQMTRQMAIIFAVLREKYC